MLRNLVRVAFVSLLAAVQAACGGTVVEDAAEVGAEAGIDADVDSGRRVHDTGVDAKIDSGRDTAVVPDTFVDPGCGDATPPPILAYDCDPFASPTKCPAGQACYPYVLPAAEPCAPETYGASCFPVGTGTEGTPCGDASGCASGFVCVVTGGGNVCAALCKVGVPGACSEGLVCSPTDVPGTGVCL